MIDRGEFAHAIESEKLELSSDAFAAYLVEDTENDQLTGVKTSSQLAESTNSLNRSSIRKVTSDLEELLDLRANVHES